MLAAAEWREVLGWNQMGLYLTPTEAGELDEAIRELLFERFGERRTRTEKHARERRAHRAADLLLPRMKRLLAHRDAWRPARPVVQPAR